MAGGTEGSRMVWALVVAALWATGEAPEAQPVNAARVKQCKAECDRKVKACRSRCPARNRSNCEAGCNVNHGACRAGCEFR
jgi:hypothetical protein